MTNKNFYMETHNAIAIKKSYENISLILTAELPTLADFDIALSLLEEIKKAMIAYHQGKAGIITEINSDVSTLTIHIPKNLHKRLNSRAASENISIDTLAAYYLTRGLSGAFK